MFKQQTAEHLQKPLELKIVVQPIKVTQTAKQPIPELKKTQTS